MQPQQETTLWESDRQCPYLTAGLTCADYKCAHSVVVDAAPCGDDVRLSDLEPKFTCKACGRRGAAVRPMFEKATMGTGAR
jgi:hypothetical protein